MRGERAVLSGGNAGETDPHRVALGTGLADDLHEWARVAAAVRRTGNGQGADVVSRRGRQLAAQVAESMGRPVRYRDPLTEQAVLVPPPAGGRQGRPRFPLRLLGRQPGFDEVTPWATGLAVAALVGLVAVIAMLALTSTLTAAVNGWVALAGASVVSAGLAPSLWLGRRVPIVRWAALGVAVGVALSWLGVLLAALVSG